MGGADCFGRLTPLYCLIRAVATSLGQLAPLSAPRLAVLLIAGRPHCCALNLTPVSGLAVDHPNPAVLALPQGSRPCRFRLVPRKRPG